MLGGGPGPQGHRHFLGSHFGIPTLDVLNLNLGGSDASTESKVVTCHCTRWVKKRTVLRVGNFATVRGRKACFQIVSSNTYKTWMSDVSEIKYSLRNVHRYPVH